MLLVSGVQHLFFNMEEFLIRTNNKYKILGN